MKIVQCHVCPKNFKKEEMKYDGNYYCSKCFQYKDEIYKKGTKIFINEKEKLVVESEIDRIRLRFALEEIYCCEVKYKDREDGIVHFSIIDTRNQL